MDECDRGNINADKFLKHTLAGHKARVNSSRESRTHCLDCEKQIPEARRKAVDGCERCVECQIRFERSSNGA